MSFRVDDGVLEAIRKRAYLKQPNPIYEMGSKEREEMKDRQPPSNEELLAAYGEYMPFIRLGADLIDQQLQVLRLFAEYLDQECADTLGEYNHAEEVAFFRERRVTLPWEKSNRGTVARGTVGTFREWRRMYLKG